MKNNLNRWFLDKISFLKKEWENHPSEETYGKLAHMIGTSFILAVQGGGIPPDELKEDLMNYLENWMFCSNSKQKDNKGQDNEVV